MMNIYFGEIHTHTSLSDGRGEPENAIKVAKKHLDFWSLADHAQWPDMESEYAKGLWPGWENGVPKMKERWHEIQRITRESYEPGKFVSFLGYEWSSTQWGDSNVYYLQDDQPLRFASSLKELYKALNGIEAIIIPHHTAYLPHQGGYDWKNFDNSKSPLVEIFSKHGSSEIDEGPYPFMGNPMGPRCGGGTVRRGLDLGYKFGFIASSDNHAAFSGWHGQGLAAVYAQTLTREALWDAFWQRRTYAVTGDRIKLDFKLNGQIMGSIIPMKQATQRHITIELDGWDCFESVEIIKNGQAIKRWHNFDFSPIERTKRFKMGIECGYHWIKSHEKTWNFSVEVDNGLFLNHQPCFKPGFHYAKLVNPRHIDVSITTKEKLVVIQRIDVDIEGNGDSRIFIKEQGKIVHSATIKELMRESKGISPYGEYEGCFYLSRAIPEPHFHIFLEWQDETPLNPEDYYYIRGIQKNGQMCWSSPIWTVLIG